ncbi:Alpha/beta hydrolase family protein [Cryptosporidium felis]|nr:Alpha/beta hydrolase family protein [Cryptosporidium felis]
MDSKYKFEEGKFMEGPNGRINYSLSFPEGDRGSYKGPLVLCFHGLMSSISVFKRLEGESLRSGLAVLRIDMPGHGLSSWSYFGKLTQDDFIRQADTVLTNLGLENLKLYLVGFSMGGLVALHYASSNPGKVLKVALLSPACFCKPLSVYQKASISYLPGLVRLIYNSIPFYLFVSRDNITEDYYCPEKVDPNVIDTRYFRHKYYGRQLRSTFGRIVTGFDFWNGEEILRDFLNNYLSLRGIQGVCFFLGLHDEMVPTNELVPKLKGFFPKARAIIYRNCKHQVLEEGENIIGDILAYLGSDSIQNYSSIGVSLDSVSID